MGGGGTHSTGIEDSDPSKSQKEFNDLESGQLLVGVSLSLTLETMLPRILSSVCVATSYLTENTKIDPRNISAIGSKTRHLVVTLEELYRKRQDGINNGREILKATAQRGICTGVHPPTCCYHTDHFSLRYWRLNTELYSETVFATRKSLRGNKCAQVFTAKDFIGVHPMSPDILE